jgi:hypothetical protein
MRNPLPPELIEKLETAMEEIPYGSAEVSWVQKGTFIEMKITEKTRFEKDISSPYKRG